MNLFLTEGDKYRQSKIPVVPITKKKECLAFGRNEIDWLNDDGFQNTYNQKDLGLGIQTGKNSEIIALDLDSEVIQKDLGKQIFDVFGLKIPAKFSNCPGKGWTYFFKWNGESSKILYKKGERAGELLSTGYYTVIPPTIHPDTKNPYIWRGQSQDYVLKRDLIELPQWIMDYFDDVQDRDSKAEDVPLVEQCGSGFDKWINENISCESIMKLNPYYQKKRERYLLINSTSKSPGANIDEKGYFRTSHGSDLFVEKFGKRALTPANLIACYFGSSKEFIQKNFAEKWRQWEMEKPKYEPEPPLKIEAKIRPLVIPETGLGKELFDYILSSAPIQNKSFAMASVISFFSIMIGNKCKFKDTLANNYSVLVAGTTTGKDYYLKSPSQLLNSLGLPDLVGMDDYGSGVSMIDNLDKYRCRIDCMDEIASLFSSFNDSASFFNSSKESALLKLYSSAGTLFAGQHTRTKGTTGRCFSPYVCLLGATTPSGLSKINEENIKAGLGSRFWLFYPDSDLSGFNYEFDPSPMPNGLWLKLSELRKSGPEPLKSTDIPELCGPVKGIIPAYYKALREYLFEGENIEVIGRSTETFNKLVLIGHGMIEGEDYLRIPIKNTTLDWAFKNTIIICQNTLLLFDRYSTQIESLKNAKIKIHKYLLKHPKTKKEISNNFRKFDKIIRDRALDDLLDSGCVTKDGLQYNAVGEYI
ncbi:MAG: bifunctional DNA primase/polymerase [Bacteriovoracales bacterium]